MSIQSVLILGIGNTLLTDEGVGVHVVRHMLATYDCGEAIELVDGGTLSFTLAEPIARADGLIVVDAAYMKSSPGSIKTFYDQDMDDYLRGNRQSVHEVSLTDLLDIARLTDTLPKRRSLVGIEPFSMEWGEELSDPVLPAVDQAACEVLSILAGWEIQCQKRA